MEQTTDAERQLLVVRRSLHSAIVEHRTTTDELKAVARELEAMLVELSARENVHPVDGEVTAAVETMPDGTSARLTVLAQHSVSQLKREADRTFRRGREIVRESISLRRRARELRAALASGKGQSVKPSVDGDGGHGPTKAGQKLSKREQQVLSLMVEGKSSKEIAAALGISFKTAVTHRASIMSKLDVHEVASVVREAIQRRLV